MDSTMKNPSLAFFIKKFFDPQIYCAYKALQFFQQKENGGFSSKVIRTNIKYFSKIIAKNFSKAGIDPWTHYTLYGTQEGINPSDFFDTKSYLAAKVKAYTAIGKKIDGRFYKKIDIARELREKKLSALEDFILHAGTGKGEVLHGITEDGEIPPEFHVPQKNTIRKIQEINPKTFFNESEYIQYKALQFFSKKENGSHSSEEILKNIDQYAIKIIKIFRDAKITAWEHFQHFGTIEEINPSNFFDTKKYLSTKAEILNTLGLTDNGKEWTSQSIAQALREMRLSVLDHFLLYAGKGKNEVPHGLNPDGTIPKEFTVDQPVGPINLKKIYKTSLLPEKTTDTLPEIVFPEQIKKINEEPITLPLVQRKKLTLQQIAFSLIFLSTLFVFVYLFFLASPCYISEMKFSVKGQEGGGTAEGLGAILNLSTPTQNDSYLISEFISSVNMFYRIDKKLQLISHYSDRSKDIWYRLEKDPTADTIKDYWQWACVKEYDPDTNILTVTVKAFSSKMALAICNEILKESEKIVNDMNIRARKDTVGQAQKEITIAKDKLTEIKKKVKEYQDKINILDPNAVIQGLYSIINGIEAEITNIEAELAQAKSYIKEDNPRIRMLENKKLVLYNQLQTEKNRLAGKVKQNETLNEILSTFQALLMEEEFAKKQLAQAMSSLETARIRADSKTQYVEAFQEAIEADESLYPRPFLFTFIYFLTSVLILGLISLIVAAVKDHTGF